MSDEKIFVGGSKEISGNYGVFHKISFSKADLDVLQANLNSKGYVNLNHNKRREPSQYGQTHSLTIDTWQPQQQTTSEAPTYNQFNSQEQNSTPPSTADFGIPETPNFDDIEDPEDCPF